MALVSPPMATSPGVNSAFSPFTDSPSSPAAFGSMGHQQQRSSGGHSDSLYPPPSPYPQFVDPSPVDSNGTASTGITDIDDDDRDGEDAANDDDVQVFSPNITSPHPLSPDSQPGKLDTSLAARTRADSDGAPQSVIHAPQDFKRFSSSPSTTSPAALRSTDSPTESSTHTVVSPISPAAKLAEQGVRSTLNTNVPPETSSGLVMQTPQAQTRQELEDEWKGRNRLSSDLEVISESHDGEQKEENGDEGVEPHTPHDLSIAVEEELPEERLIQINSLKSALSECWTLCNTLANLSLTHRKRIFNYRGKSEVQEQAWRSCWRLCQNLYESREEDHQSLVLPTLEMCREFCQALFEARQKSDDISDSVLRVSFELNNHLYNTHDRNLPSAFQERTLDFYLTLCHRLMKQRTSLPEETDTLLRACWSLAEMLFSLRQNHRDGKPPDEELLGSAVQACWELCDLFREGWTQIRPDRGTPRPSQTTFNNAQVPFKGSREDYSGKSSPSLSRSSSAAANHVNQSYLHDNQYDRGIPPETPTTIFDDSNDVDNEDQTVPNILVLGPDSSNGSSTHHNRWSSAVSNYSESSQRTSSTATLSSSQPNLARLRVLLVKVAMNNGFQVPHSTSPPSSAASASSQHHQQIAQQNNQAFLNFVKTLPSNSFGSQAWQATLVEKYRKFVFMWPSLTRSSGNAAYVVQHPPRRASAAEVAKAVQWMMRSKEYVWLRDLFRVVFGCFPDDAVSMTSTVIQA